MKNFVASLTSLTTLVCAYTASATADDAGTAHDFSFAGITGDQVDLSSYAGNVLVIVNTASRCGFTPQYDGLQELWTNYRDQGVVVLGVPSNSFRQELSSNEEVKEFCEVRFDLDFPLTGINAVRGDDSHPFYTWVRDTTGDSDFPSWNFNKVVVGPEGEILAIFGSRTKPTSQEIVDVIDQALAKDSA